MNNPILLATDLDRTILPNGPDDASPDALPRFHALAKHPEITLVYVSGRSEALLKEAIDTFGILLPAYAIGDVGTSIFVTHDGSWSPLTAWQETIAADWKGKSNSDLRELFADIGTLSLQEESKQNTFKLSYYAPEDTDHAALIATMRERLGVQGIDASLIWSIDEIAHTGLLDVLPASATKLHALQFLQTFLGYSTDRTLFCGDSGNDMPALTGGFKAVVVANARTEVKAEALERVRQKGTPEQLYIARGGFLGMNGNYSAGVLEGLAHFFPETVEWMEV